MRVCVYCGSSPGTSPAYTAAAALTGRRLAERGLGLVYGGASVGLMGVVADAALAAGGEVIGVIPRSMTSREIAHGGLTELHVVDTMAARKDLMAARSDAFLALPGGIGTLDELFETWTLYHLGERVKPLGLLDVDGFFAPLVRMVEHTVDAGFLSRTTADALVVDTDVDAVLDRMAPAPVDGAEPLDVVAWVVVRDGRLLVVRTHDRDAWYVPGGKVEPGETAVAALVREMREELAVDLDPLTVAPLTVVTGPAHGPDAGLVVDISPREDACRSERVSALPLPAGARPGQARVADRHFCTAPILCGWRAAGTGFVAREHARHPRPVGERAWRAGGRVATVSIEAMRFLRPIEVGDEVSCYCSLDREGDTSVAVRIETWTRSRDGSEAEKVTEGVFTYVALGEGGKPRALAKDGADGA